MEFRWISNLSALGEIILNITDSGKQTLIFNESSRNVCLILYSLLSFICYLTHLETRKINWKICQCREIICHIYTWNNSITSTYSWNKFALLKKKMCGPIKCLLWQGFFARKYWLVRDLETTVPKINAN